MVLTSPMRIRRAMRDIGQLRQSQQRPAKEGQPAGVQAGDGCTSRAKFLMNYKGHLY